MLEQEPRLRAGDEHSSKMQEMLSDVLCSFYEALQELVDKAGGRPADLNTFRFHWNTQKGNVNDFGTSQSQVRDMLSTQKCILGFENSINSGSVEAFRATLKI